MTASDRCASVWPENKAIDMPQKRRNPFQSPLACSDRLVLFSDGISSRMSVDETHDLSPEQARQLIIDRHRRNHDDATVLVADVEP
jgi:hypothetical protein